MSSKKYTTQQLWIIFILFVSFVGLTACSSDGAESGEPQELNTRLLVRAPDEPLTAGLPLDVKSRTVDSEYDVSHVELYAVELPTGEKEILIRSDAAPFDQTAFTVSQMFVPMESGHYVIKVVGYNTIGENTESDYISFQVK